MRKGGSQTFIHSPFCGHTIIILADSYMKVLRQKLIMCGNCNHCNFKLDFNLCKSDDRSNFYDRYAFNLDSNNCNSSFNYCKSDDHSDLCDHYAFNLDSNNRNSTFISRLSGRSKGPKFAHDVLAFLAWGVIFPMSVTHHCLGTVSQKDNSGSTSTGTSVLVPLF